MGNLFVYPSPKPTYEYIKDDQTLIFVPQKIDNSFCGTLSCAESRKISSKIPCRYIPCQTQTSPYLILFFHGNSEDIGTNLSILLSSFSEHFMMNVLCPEYPNYGIYKKKDDSLRMDEAILEDARRVLKFCNTNLRFKYENIILMGRSLGTAVAVQLAVEFPKVRGVILISPYTTIRGVAKHMAGHILSKVVSDVFRTIDYIDQVQSPLLFIHGEQDGLVPHEMSKELYEKAKSAKVLKLNGRMTHNQFKIESDIFSPMRKFMMDKLNLKSYLLSITADTMAKNYEIVKETRIKTTSDKSIETESFN